MNKKSIYVLAACLAASCMLTLAPAQAATKKPEPPKQNHGSTVKHIERDITGAAKNIEHKIEQHGVKKYQEKQKQDANKKDKK